MIDPIDVPVDIAAVVPEGNPSDIPASNSELVVKPISANLKFIRSATFAQMLSLNSEDIEEMEQSFKNDDKNNLFQPSDKRLINSRLNYKKKSIKMQSAKSDLMAIQKKKIALLIMNFCIMVIFNLCYSIGLSFVFVNETIMLSYKFVQGAIRQIRTSEFQLPQWYFLLIYIALFAGQSYCNWKSLQISIEGQKRLTKLQINERQLQILEQNIADIFDI